MNYRMMTLFIVTILTGFVHADEAPNSLRTMTYNIRREGSEAQEDRTWPQRKSRVVELWKTINPDVVGLQEVMTNQQQQLQESFPEFDFIGESRGSSWFGFGPSEATPIAYKKELLELQEQGTFPVNATVDSWVGWMPWHVYQTGLLPRICTWAKFKNKQNNKEFYLYNTHLDHKFEQARLNSAYKIMDDIAQRTADLPVIVTGDFNTAFEGDMQKACGSFTHAKQQAKLIEGPAETSTGWDNTSLKEIDHIVVNNKIEEVPSYRVIEADGYPSDHRPVVADIVF